MLLLLPGAHNFRQPAMPQALAPHRCIRNYHSVVKVNLDSSMQCTYVNVFLSAINTAEQISLSLFLTCLYKVRTSDINACACLLVCFLSENTKQTSSLGVYRRNCLFNFNLQPISPLQLYLKIKYIFYETTN
jgi:hypothetical protein